MVRTECAPDPQELVVTTPAQHRPESAPGDVFVDRHIGPRTGTDGRDDVAHMLGHLGYDSVDALIDAAVPASIRLDGPLDLPAARTETEVLADLRRLASQNETRVQMIGQGYWDTVTPAVIRRGVLENPAWYTAYTPYQPEISQGRLEALLNFQTVVSDLTGLEVANASLLDEATAVAEAVALMWRAAKRPATAGPGVVVLDADLFPQTVAVTLGRAEAIGLPVVVADLDAGYQAGVDAALAAAGLEGSDVVGLVVQQLGASGQARALEPLVTAAKEAGALVTVATDLLALTLFTAPGDVGADIAVGSAQRLGVPLFFGGPHAAFMSVRKGIERMLPGRLVGVSVDADGDVAYRLALQTREQHIRREKATSNICTAQALLAIVASMYAVYHGPAGLRAIAERVHGHALALADRLRGAELDVEHAVFFDTVRVAVPGTAAEVVARADAAGINLWAPDADHVQVACDETTTDAHLDAVVEAFVPGSSASGYFVSVGDLPAEHRRTSDYLTHPVFHAHRSETQMMRYLRTLADKDLALDRTMIPLGSCTMKLNAAIQMEPISWPEYAGIHPFAPAAQTGGYDELIGTLEANLAEITGYAAVSVQPNAGSQGEFAGLLAIRNYHRSRDEAGRDICLIPASAHGTNAASAAMAGMRVVVVATADDGEILLDDLRAKLEQHGPQVAAIMITYPSTHGVYEDTVREVCDLVHAAGGQVYIDGANLNALVGLAKPGQFGGDVSHLNLHKTFCIPHGGGGPGVGPVGVAEHLVPFLPGAGSAPVSAAPAGSAGILPIPYAYVALMGPDGLRRATETAVVSANYLAVRLRDAFPVLFTGPGGLVAHECILDLRPLTAQTGVTAEDVAKRLMDYGFHAPTLSFPVPGTLMVEPTESEDLAEIDRFVDAMLAIRAEIDQVADGTWDLAGSPLRNAPHSAASVVSDAWDKPYSRELAAYPVAALRAAKYWPPVRRIDGAKGDRNLVCSCPPIEAYADDVAEPTETTLAHAAVGA
ncbi:glycine dehydrogenase (decarboxylating) alpha subunit /glycine dehydrogenase (decarboxylating) beta subunit [Sanguibacter keddieii DSM 10542]|uniref:Glycine dehydrogenase (decarboxylating) n=1 Tax=Sanguibacter keddieii (strain ATCC 51767 / DSM 10542 / NCFB 3025 / ST-74) TaxID=446469 RepID=D1BI48_SANKS|nr:glycine dehydrogenase (decarboxylating) alpha subunit /glycine dehydrogenase (decarboxylating) beta subunit [Sanguibacter keddieii DSM 10542]